MKKCLVIGGGIAGLTSAVYLLKAGFKVELLESSPKLGGRAYSFQDLSTGTVIDNGQHILMGCYKETLKFLKIINAEDNLHIQKRLSVNFLAPKQKLYKLKSFPLFYPLNLVAGLLNYKALNFNERIRLLLLLSRLPFYSGDKLESLSIYEWLEMENQSMQVRKAFWEIIAVGAMNTNIEKASAKVFVNLIKRMFLNGNFSTKIILPAYGLTETYCNHAEKFIEDHCGIINLQEGIQSVNINNNKICEVITTKKSITEFDYLISSVPQYALKKIFPEENFSKTDFAYSSILSVHLWLKENVLDKTFYGLIDSHVHWIFNHGSHLTIVISDADKYIDESKENILSIILSELEKYTNIKREMVESFKIIKEKRATFVASKETQHSRPCTKTNISNFFLAGDWIDTGLPSTIESAVLSGRLAAEAVIAADKK